MGLHEVLQDSQRGCCVWCSTIFCFRMRCNVPVHNWENMGNQTEDLTKKWRNLTASSRTVNAWCDFILIELVYTSSKLPSSSYRDHTPIATQPVIHCGCSAPQTAPANGHDWGTDFYWRSTDSIYFRPVFQGEISGDIPPKYGTAPQGIRILKSPLILAACSSMYKWGFP